MRFIHVSESRVKALINAVCLQRAPHGFQNNMKVEVVDRRNPMLIRVASIVDTEDYRVKVSQRKTQTRASHLSCLSEGHFKNGAF